MVISRPECVSDKNYTLIGKNNNREYRVEIVRSNHGNKEGLIQMPECAGMVKEIIKTYLRSYPQRNPDLAKPRIEKSLSYPYTIAELVHCGDELVGVGIFPRFAYGTDKTLYSSRFFVQEHTGEGLGTRILEDAILLHQQELRVLRRPPLRWLAFMTQNPHTLESIWKLPMIGETRPIYHEFVEGQRVAKLNYYKQGEQPQIIMLRTHIDHRMGSLNIETMTGISRGEMRELGSNESYKPGLYQRLAWQIHKLMVDYPPLGLGMNTDAGDEMYTVCEILNIKRQSSSGSETSLPSAA